MDATEPRERDDQALWDACVRDDADAFGVLFERHHHAVYNYCFRRSGSWAQADDLTASVFLEAWRTRRPLDLTAGGALPWLIGIATNVTRSDRRSAARRDELLAKVSRLGLETAPDFADDLADRVDDEQRMGEVLRALRELPQRDQDVLSVCVFAGLGYEEAAKALGIPVGTIRSRLSRARRRLEQRLGIHPSNDPQLEKQGDLS